ncbi:MAG TPA: DNA (cytosine-5-)-methyltransferase [Acetobacteraceae bacterium]|jgi:DNA (cytosine-5)-methyltransferase 1|nr:DNA (cytosine-5-)-methyltransferase [Acetobacteraceae bacterium]
MIRRVEADGPASKPASVGAPTFIDVFAGCGGLSLGLKRAGWHGLFAIEKDRFAFDTLSSNFPIDSGPLSYSWPEAIERTPWDIAELLRTKSEALEALAGTVDLLAGGPPCQGFSHAGRRRPDDPRNRLFEAYLELVRIVRPRVVLIENVRGFTSSFDRRGHDGITNFAETLHDRLDADYDTVSAIVRASDLGVPQSRSRFFLVGVRKGELAGDGLSRFFDDLHQHTAAFLAPRGLPRRPTARDAIGDLEVGHNGTVPCDDSPGFDAIDYQEPRSAYQIFIRDGHEGRPSDTRLARHRPDIRDRFASIIRSSCEEGRLNVSISPETRKAHGLKKMAIRVMDPLSPAPTITSLPDDLLHYSEPRTLTVRENARLQSFPDWFKFKGKYTTGGHLRVKEVPRFTQVANAVPPLIAEQIGLRLISLLGLDRVDMGGERPTDNGEGVLVSAQLAAE